MGHNGGDHNADGLNFRRDAGADKKIDKAEFQALAEQAGIHDQAVIDKAFDKLAGADGMINKDEVKDGLGDTTLSKSDLAKKINELGGEDKKDINFGKAAGADKALTEDEFKELAKKAGITDEDQISQVFDQVAGADGKIDKDEFKAAFGDTKLSGDDFKKKFDQLAQDDSATSDPQAAGSDDCGCDETPDSTSSSTPDSSGAQHCGSSDSQPVWTHEVKDGRLPSGRDKSPSRRRRRLGHGEEQQTRRIEISGDPHFDVGNNGSNDFDFKKDMTLKLDDGTKITIGTVDAGNGTTLASSLTITNGDNSIQVTGLGADKDGANNLKAVQSNAGETVDDLTADGAITLFENGAQWLTAQGNAVTQDIINQAEA